MLDGIGGAGKERRQAAGRNHLEVAALAPAVITKCGQPRSEELTSGRSSQVSVDVSDMPEDLGRLPDKGIADHVRGR